MRGRACVAMPVVALALAVALAGCGLSLGGGGGGGRGGGSDRQPPGDTAAGARAVVVQAQRTHELPTPAPRQTAPGGWRSPVQAVQVFADTYINWTASTVADHLRALAQATVGQAHSAMTLAAAQVGTDSDLRRGGIANAGIVEAIAPVTGERNVYAVVTRERTTATNTNAYQGLQPGWHVALATVVRVDGGLWTLSAWQPQN